MSIDTTPSAGPTAQAEPGSEDADGNVDRTERLDLLFRDLRTSPDGLTNREAARRLERFGPNALRRTHGRRWPRQLLDQFTHPLAILLWVAAGLAAVAGITAIAIAIVVVIVLNAAFAFAQEQQAERAVEALQAYLPVEAKVARDGVVTRVPAADLVPGDVLVLEEGDRICADGRLISGSLEVDLSTLTGESQPATRAADLVDADVPLIDARELVFSGSACTEGDARAVVVATGMHTELGRIAALSQRPSRESSPLERQVRRVAWLIAAVAVGLAVAFLPIATFGGGLPLHDSILFAVGLIAGNVPEGLLPVITLALAVAVRKLARQGAVMKRLSSAETLGSTTVICTDKTGTLTQNRMQAQHVWMPGAPADLLGTDPATVGPAATRLAGAVARCNNASTTGDRATGDPTELALLDVAGRLGGGVDVADRIVQRRQRFSFDPRLKRMTTIDEVEGSLWVNTKGAPEAVLPLCTSVVDPDGRARDLLPGDADEIRETTERFARDGLRVLAVASRPLDATVDTPVRREVIERDLQFLGLVALADPPRPEVAEAVRRCHTAGIRILVVTGDHPLTATAVARDVGISGDHPTVITGPELDRVSEVELEELLASGSDVIFARSSPEAKLRITDALRASGQIVAMTGDGVNDAPALRAADIGIAMGASGTDVAREAATMVLTDDNFATIVRAVEGGRQVYDNIRKFMVYIFAHTTPEVVPYLVFALARGLVPLPLTVLQLLCFDVGTETVPALALGREPAEPGLMDRPPRDPSENLVRRSMLAWAWLFMGAISATLSMGAFFVVLHDGGWTLGAPTDASSPLHHLYLQATTITFLSMVACQIGTAFASRTERVSLFSIGVMSNRLLLWGIVFEVALSAVFVGAPFLQPILGTAVPSPSQLALILPFPFIVWGADELRRWFVRRRHAANATLNRR